MGGIIPQIIHTVFHAAFLFKVPQLNSFLKLIEKFDRQLAVMNWESSDAKWICVCFIVTIITVFGSIIHNLYVNIH